MSRRLLLEDLYGESRRDFAPVVFECSICETKFNKDWYEEYEFEGEPICEFCLKEDFDRCQNCGKVWEKGGHKECPECKEWI